MSYKMKYKCVIFDCDGILVDSEGIANKVLIEMAKEIGVEISYEFAELNFAGKSDQSCFDYIESQASIPLPSNFGEEFVSRTFALFEEELQPVKGVPSLLSRLNMPVCVASSAPLDKVKLNLKNTNLINKFNGKIYSGNEINSWKPEPDIFLHAAEQMNYQPHECVVIEDSIAGIQAAIAGGFDVYALAGKNNKDLLEKEGARVFFDMNELDNILNEE